MTLVERERWDSMLHAWPRAHLLQSFASGALQQSRRWMLHRMLVDAGGGRSLPLTALVGAPSPALGPCVYLPRGPACAPDDSDAWPAVIGGLEHLARGCDAVRITVEPHAWEEEIPLVRRALGAAWRPSATRQPPQTAIVDLRGGYDAVLARMRPKGRYNVRLAERAGVVTESIADPRAGAEILGALCAVTARRQGARLPSASQVLRVLEAHGDSARICVARVDGEPAAALLLVTFGEHAVYLYGGSLERHRAKQPSSALQAYAMRVAIAAGCSDYDLWGMPPRDARPDHRWFGLRQFKRALGGVERTAAGAWTRPWGVAPVAVSPGQALGSSA